jgi:hypothetical protein
LSRNETRRSLNKTRLAVAIVVATIATIFSYAEHLRLPGRSSDFGIVWFGARSLLHGVDPYPLVGPGRAFNWEWHLYYPATSMVATLPLGLLSETTASLAFVWVSAALLTYGLTREGWTRIWILPSAAFISAARSAQWSPLYCAAYLMPPLAWMLSAKPTLGVAVAASARTLRTIKFATIGTIVLFVVSIVLLPRWPAEWIAIVRQQNDLAPAIAWTGGGFILLAALRWRLPEARLLLAMGLVPTTAAWYEALPLLLIGKSKRECQALSLISSIGYILQGMFLNKEGFIERGHIRVLMLLFCYAPPLWVVLRRHNVSPMAEDHAFHESPVKYSKADAATIIQG